MDKLLKCECGCNQFWFFITGNYFRCTKCHNEYKLKKIKDQIIFYVRKFNLLKNNYENWEQF